MKIKGAWVPHRMQMLQSPAWAALSHATKRILERLEIELMRHAGKGNGDLICTYQDFVAHGIRRMSIGPGIQQGTALGFMEVTKMGWTSPDHSNPSRYRLTYLPTDHAEPTDEWMHIKPNARQPLKPVDRKSPKTARKNHFTSSENATSTGSENATPVAQSLAETLGAKTLLLSTMLSSLSPGKVGEDESVGLGCDRMAMAAMSKADHVQPEAAAEIKLWPGQLDPLDIPDFLRRWRVVG